MNNHRITWRRALAAGIAVLAACLSISARAQTVVESVTSSVQGELVRFSGVGDARQVAGVLVDGQAVAYRMQDGDAAALVAAALAVQIRVQRPALLQEASISLPGGRGIVARVVADGQGGRELRRQEAGFRVTLWCPIQPQGIGRRDWSTLPWLA